jgi:hypothetical protein
MRLCGSGSDEPQVLAFLFSCAGACAMNMPPEGPGAFLRHLPSTSFFAFPLRPLSRINCATTSSLRHFPKHQKKPAAVRYMGFQNILTSLPSQVSGANACDSQPVHKKSELLHEKAGGDEADREVVEKSKEYDPDAHIREPATRHRSTFLSLPKVLCNTIYSYALAVEEGLPLPWSGISQSYTPRGRIRLQAQALQTLIHAKRGPAVHRRLPGRGPGSAQAVHISEKGASQVAINQLKYICKQLHHKTRGIRLKINAGKKIIFHGTRKVSSGMTNWLSQGSSGCLACPSLWTFIPSARLNSENTYAMLT